MTVIGRCLAAILCAAAVAALALPATAAPQPAIISTGYVPSGGYGIGTPLVGDVTVGWEFTPLRDIWVTDLGFYDLLQDGLNIPHTVGIWNSQQELLISDTVQPLGACYGEYRYVEITPLLLTAGQTYIIGATAPVSQRWPPAFEYDWYPRGWNGLVPLPTVVDAVVRIDTADWYYSDLAGGSPEAALVFPGEHLVPISPDIREVHMLAPNFRFTEVPEPATLALLAIGAMAVLRRRLAGR